MSTLVKRNMRKFIYQMCMVLEKLSFIPIVTSTIDKNEVKAGDEGRVVGFIKGDRYRESKLIIYFGHPKDGEPVVHELTLDEVTMTEKNMGHYMRNKIEMGA